MSIILIIYNTLIFVNVFMLKTVFFFRGKNFYKSKPLGINFKAQGWGNAFP